jgi:hypothetical protein
MARLTAALAATALASLRRLKPRAVTGGRLITGGLCLRCNRESSFRIGFSVAEFAMSRRDP